MVDEKKNDKVTLEELIVSTLAMTDARWRDDRQGHRAFEHTAPGLGILKS